ncbi:MAG TPA: hypothetical protein VKZ18_22390 [Polyangia bacterium]|nr:hypothetical protein [Polyangia bacterium]
MTTTGPTTISARAAAADVGRPRRRHLPLAAETGGELAAQSAPFRASWPLSRRFIKTALWCTLTMGASFGAINLLTIHLALGPVPPAHNWVHASFQLIGFVLLFVMGVAYQVVPRSCRVPLARVDLARASFRLTVGGLLLRAYGQFGPLLPATAPSLLLGGLAILGGVVAFVAVLAATWRSVPHPRPRVGCPEIAAGTLWWMVAAALLVLEGVRAVRGGDADLGARYNESFYLAALLGGALSWVQGMVRRMEPTALAFRPPRARWLAAAFAASQLGAAAATVGAALPADSAAHHLRDAGLVVAALALGAFVIGARVFERSAPRPFSSHLAPLAVRRAVRFAFASAVLFAALALACGVADLTGHLLPTAAWDGARHALALGCITTMILALGSHLVPRFAGAPLRRAGARDAGLILIAVGLVGREAEVLAPLLGSPRLLWISGSSGLVAATGVALAASAILGATRTTPGSPARERPEPALGDHEQRRPAGG